MGYDADTDRTHSDDHASIERVAPPLLDGTDPTLADYDPDTKTHVIQWVTLYCKLNDMSTTDRVPSGSSPDVGDVDAVTDTHTNTITHTTAYRR